MYGLNYTVEDDFYYPDETPTDKCIHYTMIFNAFVFQTLFHEINARKTNDKELNIFEGFFDNWYFIGILFANFIAQILFVQLGGGLFRTAALSFD